MRQYTGKTIDGVTRPPLQRPRKRLRRVHGVLLVVGCLMLFGLAAGLYWWAHRNDQRILTDHYQAVYMTNGQMYFGKLQNTQGEYLTLTSVYIPQPSNGSQDASATKGETSLVKVTQQVYGPDDSVALRASQVQFWQNLRTDSKVTQAIKTTGQPQ